MDDNKRINFIYLSVILALGLIIASLIIANTWRKVSRNNVTITVTGSSQKDIRSDLAIWSGSYQAGSTSLTDAYSKLKENTNTVRDYLKSKGMTDDKIKFSPVQTTTQYVMNEKGYATTQVSGYRLSQTVTIESGDVDMVDKLSRDASELIYKGIDFNSEPPEFLYTKLSDLKIEMIGLASQDAKARAEQIAKSTGDKVGEVRSSRMGVIQINAKNSTDVTDYGVNDTSSLEKTIRAVVTVSFSVD